MNEAPADPADGKTRKRKDKAKEKKLIEQKNFSVKTIMILGTFGAVLSTGANAGQVRAVPCTTYFCSID